MPAGKRGRLPVKPPHLRFPIPWAHDLLTVPLKAATYPVDVRGPQGPGDIWGNDVDGDCVFAAVLFIRLFTAARAGITPLPTWTSQQAINEYLLYNGGKDIGAVIADALLWLYKRGEILGFAPAPHHDRATCDALAQELDMPLLCGGSLTDHDESDFEVRPWGSEGNTPDNQLGHAFNKVYSDGVNDEKYRTWANFQDALLVCPVTGGAWADGVIDEAWVVITTEAQKAKFSPQLFAILDSLPGFTGPTPAPTPTPTPAPTPTPTPTPTPVPDITGIVKVLQAVVAVLEGAANQLRKIISEL